jgi:fructose-1,6-bisphosphatase II
LKSFQLPATSGDGVPSTARNLQPVYDQGVAARLDRTLALEVARITEAAAMAAARWSGRGDKIAADQAAVDAMRRVMDTIGMRGTVVIGEGEKDEAPMLYNGEQVGSGEGPEVDIAVDPLEGTNLCARGAPNSIAVIAFAERGTMLFPGAAVYMDKIAVGPEAKDAIDLDASPADNVTRVAEAKGMRPEEVTVVVLDRDRHEDLIAGLRDIGARVSLITDGDVAPAIAAATPGSGVDLLMGVGGTPEGVISAAAVKSLGGAMQGRLWPRNDDERQELVDGGYDVDRKLVTDDLVSGDDLIMAATGVTDGTMLRGVHFDAAGGAVTESLVIRSPSGTIRRLVSEHAATKVAHLAPS